MTIAAHEAGDRRLLAAAITGAYPTSRVRRALRRLGLERAGRLARLLERDERLPDDRLRPLFAPELLFEVARALIRIPVLGRLRPWLSGVSVRFYGRLAGRELGRNGANEAGVYHFRAGFGLSSVARAQRLGLVTLCDQSAVHPQVVDELLARRGDLEGLSRRDPALLHPLWRAKLVDLDRADAIVVNSELLREMFVELGEDPGGSTSSRSASTTISSTTRRGGASRSSMGRCGWSSPVGSSATRAPMSWRPRSKGSTASIGSSPSPGRSRPRSSPSTASSSVTGA